MTRAVIPLLFAHRDSDVCILCTTEQSIRRFFDNRNPSEWWQYPASDAEIRRHRQ